MPAHAASYQDTILGEPTLLHYWPMTESPGAATLAPATSGSPALRLAQGATAGAAGPVGPAAAFDGINAYAASQAPIDLSGYRKIAIEAVVNYSPWDHDQMLWEFSANYGGATGGFGLYDDHTAGQLVLGLNGEEGPSTERANRAFGDPWHHIVAVYDKTASATEVNLYLDGVLRPALSRPNDSDNTNTFGKDVLYLMSRGGMTLQAFGKMQHLAIYSDLGADRIQAHVQASGLVQTLTVSGTMAPDASGVYVLAGSYHGQPAWRRRSDSAYWLYWMHPTIEAWSIGPTPGAFAVPTWTAYLYNGIPAGTYTAMFGANGTATVTLARPDPTPTPPPTPTPAPTPAPSGVTVTPGQYLAKLPHPAYKPGHTLPPLTKWSWPYSYELTVEMARWGYALDFGDNAATLNNPASRESKLAALAHDYPSSYSLCVDLPRLTGPFPASVYTHDTSGTLTGAWSPEAPDSVMQDMATSISQFIRQVQAKAPIAIVLNGGERYMSVLGIDSAKWHGDPAVMAAKGSLSWSDYQSQRKAHQETFFTNTVHALCGGAPYIWYFAGNQFRADKSFWDTWDWDYRWMRTITDYPNSSMYYKEFNDGWSDMLTQSLNGYGYASALGHPLSYNWVCAGYHTDPRDPRHGDLALYTGYLKCYYTAGMIGGIAGYFSYPTGGFDASFDQAQPPHWLKQIEVLGRVHAEFSYLEDALRKGDLLPGPNQSSMTAAQPAYEFPTGYDGTRVLARKCKGQRRWLITAWAADGATRTVSVAIPLLGAITVQARPEGSVYDARISSGKTSLTLLDGNQLKPTPLLLPTATPDSDAGPEPTPAPTATPTPAATATPTPAPTPMPTPKPTPTPTPSPTPTPTPVATATPTPTPSPTPTPVPLSAKVAAPATLAASASPPLQIDYADTVSAPQGAWVTLWGISFGNSATAGTVSIGSVAIPLSGIQSWTDRRIDFQVPATARSGFLSVKVGSQVSNTLYFTVRAGNLYFVNPGRAGASDANSGDAGHPWKTVARGLRDLKPGDTLYLAQANYTEALQPAAGGSLLLPVMIKALPGQSVIVKNGTGVTAMDGIVVNGTQHPGLSDLVFSGLTLRVTGNAIRISGGAARCQFYGIDADASQAGLTIDGGNVGTLVAQSAFNHCAGFGVSLQNGAAGAILRDCTVSDSPGTAGGFVADDTATTVTLARCLARRNKGDGFKLSAKGITVNECSAYQNANGMRLLRSARLQNCWVYGNQSSGIVLGRVGTEKPQHKLINCTVAGPHAAASIKVAAGATATLRNTVSVGGLGPAIAFDDAATSSVLDHIIVQTDGGASAPVVTWGAAKISSQALSGGMLQKTAAGNNTMTVGISPYALFVDYSQGDLRLSPASPARRVGTIQDAPAYDFFRQVRTASTGAVDLGACEYKQAKSNLAKMWSMYE